MLNKKSIGSRTRRTRRKKQPKFVTPDLVLVAGQIIRFVAEEGNALSEAERLCGEYAEMEEDDQARAAIPAARLSRRSPVSATAQAISSAFRPIHSGSGGGRRPKDPSTSKWVHDDRAQSRGPVCRDPRRTDPGEGLA